MNRIYINKKKKESGDSIPSPEAKSNLPGVLLHRWTQKSLRIEFQGVRVDCWIVQHEPGTKKRRFSRNSYKRFLVCYNLPNISDNRSTFWYQVAVMYIILGHTMG